MELTTAAELNAALAPLQTWLHPLRGQLPELYVVGGAVRDSLLGRPFKDIDLACFEPDALSARLAEAHGAVRVPFLKRPESPCYRVVKHGCPEDFLDIAGLPQDCPASGALHADLKRRDFTINAMALPVRPDGTPGACIDPFNGQQDLRAEKIRLVSQWGFQNDPVRLFRAVRFAAKLNCALTARTLELMRRDAHLACLPAAERVTMELGLTLETERGLWAVRHLDAVNALSAMLPEIDAMRGCEQNDFHHLDVWGHSLLVLEILEDLVRDPEPWLGNATPRFKDILRQGDRLAMLKLAALLHDVGKPKARFWNAETDRFAFHRHQQIGAEMAWRIALRLKMRREDAILLRLLVAEHMHIFDLSRPEVKRSTLMRWLRHTRADALLCLALAIADIRATRGAACSPGQRRDFLNWAKSLAESYVAHLEQESARTTIIRGRDLLALGAPAGPHIGAVIRQVEEARDDHLVRTREQALRLARELLGLPQPPA